MLTGLTVACGYTVIVNDIGVTVMVAITVVVPALVAVKDGIFPVPLPASPMDGALLTHA